MRFVDDEGRRRWVGVVVVVVVVHVFVVAVLSTL